MKKSAESSQHKIMISINHLNEKLARMFKLARKMRGNSKPVNIFVTPCRITFV